MSTNVTRSPLKNEEETKKIKQEIGLLESRLASALVALEEAQRLVAGLTKTLNEHKSSIAPIRLLPSEIISSIIELCALDDWRSPLRIACVSHHLRNAVLNTPRSWCSVLANERKGRTELYFERSGQCNLHVGSSVHITFPGDVIHRIKCMTAKYLDVDDIFAPFLSLERLCVQEIGPSLGISDITTTSFPLLRHLDLSDVRNQKGWNEPSLLPLESLGLRVQPLDRTRLPFIRGCSASLTSLYLVVTGNFFPDAPTQLDLPTLNYLKIEYTNSPHADLSWLDMNAPKLRVYVDRSNDDECRCSLTNGLKAISHLRIDEAPALSELRDIRALQLKLPVGDIYQFLAELTTGEVVLSHLESLEFSDWWVVDETYQVQEDIRAIINEWESTHYPGLRPLLISEPWAKGPHWNPFTSCDIHMPCNPYGMR